MNLFKRKCNDKKFIFNVDNINISSKDFVDAKIDGVMTLRLIEEGDVTVKNIDDYLYDTSLFKITPQMCKKSKTLKQSDIMDIKILVGTILESNIKELIGTYTFDDFNKHKSDFTRKALRKTQNFALNEGVIVDYVIQKVRY